MAVGSTRPSFSNRKVEMGGNPPGMAPTTLFTLAASSPSHCEGGGEGRGSDGVGGGGSWGAHREC